MEIATLGARMFVWFLSRQLEASSFCRCAGLSQEQGSGTTPANYVEVMEPKASLVEMLAELTQNVPWRVLVANVNPSAEEARATLACVEL